MVWERGTIPGSSQLPCWGWRSGADSNSSAPSAAQRGFCTRSPSQMRFAKGVSGRYNFYAAPPLLTQNIPMILDVSSSTSDSSMSSTSRLSVTGSGDAVLRFPTAGERELSSSPIPWKGDSEPVGDGASMLGEGTGDSSGSGSVAFS